MQISEFIVLESSNVATYLLKFHVLDLVWEGVKDILDTLGIPTKVLWLE